MAIRRKRSDRELKTVVYWGAIFAAAKPLFELMQTLVDWLLK
jgi:hypothetical protein